MRIVSLIVLALILSVSCQNRNKYILSNQKAVSVIADLYLVDAIYLSRQDFPVDLTKIDSAAFYGPVFEKHGVTRAQFDSTMKKLTENPEKLHKIYTEVIEQLSKMDVQIKQEVEAQKEKRTEIIEKNHWPLKEKYTIPEDGSYNEIEFEIPFMGPGTYSVSADIKVFEDDESKMLRTEAYFAFEDDNGAVDKMFFTPAIIGSKGETRTYTVSKNTSRTDIDYLKGKLIAHAANSSEGWKKHVEVSEIKVTFIPVELEHNF